MNKEKGEDRSEAKSRPQQCWCPFCFGMRVFEERRKRHREFFVHLDKARIEILQAFRSLIDERIADLEKQKKKVTKVEVE
jgi:hypothetical protein